MSFRERLAERSDTPSAGHRPHTHAPFWICMFVVRSSSQAPGRGTRVHTTCPHPSSGPQGSTSYSDQEPRCTPSFLLHKQITCRGNTPRVQSSPASAVTSWLRVILFSWYWDMMHDFVGRCRLMPGRQDNERFNTGYAARTATLFFAELLFKTRRARTRTARPQRR